MHTKSHPYPSRIKERELLTAPSSTKRVYHISLELESAPFPYRVGDSIAVLPSNDAALVDQILHHLRATGKEEILDARTQNTYSLREFLTDKANLNRVNSSFFRFLCEMGTLSPLLDPEKKTELTAYLHQHTLLELLERHPFREFPLFEFCKLLMPLMPRFYSIASSPKVFPQEVHLTVAHVQYEAHGQPRYGVGSHFLCQSAQVGITPIPIYLQPSHHFTLPENENAPILLIGPGTGIAPFRAFLQERMAMQAAGKNWLFYGERNRSTDFYYGDYFLELEKKGHLRLDLAFSRDQKEKIYVQHKMLEQKGEIWRWIQEGCFLYVCGDAEKMAKDVEAALFQILKEEGNMTEEGARLFLKKLRTDKRYLLDVY